jgi:N-acetylmuramoyl-L-alanine amidase
MSKRFIPISWPSALAFCLTLPLISCVATTEPRFVIDDQSYQAQGKNERINFIVLHYTAEDEPTSLELLTTKNVSAHYLIPKADNDKIYHLVPDNERAWHAGSGGFAGRTVLNDTSIGIEIVNDGIQLPYRGSLKSQNLAYHPTEHFVDFKEVQVRKIAQLVTDLTKRYDIAPKNIIGHSDMAPSRKIDPGAKFPWERLYKEYGVGAWYDEADKQQFMNQQAFELQSIADIKQALRDYGYQINNTEEWDKPSRNVIYAFQLHFRPDNLSAEMDLETYAILRALNKKYKNKH